MESGQFYDAIIVGGGPAGSSCAYHLVKSGLKTLLLDRANFPRVKLCAGWVTTPIWEVLELDPNDYPLGLWKFNKVLVHFRGRHFKKKAEGYFIRRYEFDHFLLQRSQVETVEGHHVRHIERDHEGYWVIDDQYRTKYLIGAGGTYCPVARKAFPNLKKTPFGTQEIEFEGNPLEIKAHRTGEDGEPEILLHDDLLGYSWNVPKSNWVNIGTGTKDPREVKSAWNDARTFFEEYGHDGTIPPSSKPLLDKMKGHGYVNFATNHLNYCQRDNVFLVGDALGLAQPLTGEGILPAVLSGKLCATAIIKNQPEIYHKLLQTHPIFKGYQDLFSIRSKAARIFKGNGKKGTSGSGLFTRFVVNTFVALFSGKPIPVLKWLSRMGIL